VNINTCKYARRCGPFTWTSGEPQVAQRLRQCKVRHGPEVYTCRVLFDASSNGGSSTSGAGGSNGSDSRGSGQHGKGRTVSSSEYSGSHSSLADSAAEILQAGAYTATQLQDMHGAESTCGAGTINCAMPTGSQVPHAAQSQLSSNGSVGGTDGGWQQPCGSAAAAVVWLDAQDQGVAPGQYAVFYDGDVCLGSAVIQEALSLPDEIQL
jgi:tRNA methyl transferase